MDSVKHGGNLLGLNLAELEDLAVSYGQPRYRGRQLYHGIYARRVQDFAGFTDLDREFRESLSASHRISCPEVQRQFRSQDGSVRFLLRLEDGNSIETVYMPEENRTTLCLSSQVGCALD